MHAPHYLAFASSPLFKIPSSGQAPACSIGEIARAVIADDPRAVNSQSLADSSKVDRAHSERNAHRLFNRYGIALKVPISYLDVATDTGEDNISLPYLRITDYLQLLAQSYPHLLLGGLEMGTASQELCQTFWLRYRRYHPEHRVFERYTEEDFKFCLPVYIHGDKGRTLQKSPIFVMSWEVPWGLGPEQLANCEYDNLAAKKRQVHDGRLKWSCSQRFLGKRTHAEMQCCTMGDPKLLDHSLPGCHQRHNAKGHSYLSRFLICAVTSKVYKRNSQILPSLLKVTASELETLFESGIEAKPGVNLKIIFLGAKGDGEWHFEAAGFNRSYHNASTKSELSMCHFCDAGKPGLSFSDSAQEPAWAQTLGVTDPWDSPPPLDAAPYASTFKASMYKFDPFHVLKFGVFRDAVGSVLVRLCLMAYFDFDPSDSLAIESRFERAFNVFSLWCLAERKFPAIKHFTKANMHFESYRKFPWLNCKGSDVTLVMMWLSFQLRLILLEPLKDAAHRQTFQAMLQMLEGGLHYIGIMHSHGLWLPRFCGMVQLKAGMRFYRGYLYLASQCMEEKVAGFRLRPKIHYFHHLLHDVQTQLQTDTGFIFSSGAYLCEQNEDFIGRISRVSRRVSARSAGLRTTQRYLVKVRSLLDRLHGKKRP